ncbi:MAG: hypothetical protein RI973_1250 [Bacteroidota bacterium]|jgi:peroxiredoxin
MNKLFFIACLLLLSALQPDLGAQGFRFSPEKPVPGETVTVTYDPQGTKLEGLEVEDLVASAIDFGTPGLLSTQSLEFNVKDGVCTAQLSTSPGMKAVYFRAANYKQNKTDANADGAYILYFYNPDRVEKLPGAIAAEAYIKTREARRAGFEKSRDKEGLELLKTAFRQDISLLQNSVMTELHASLSANTKDAEGLETSKARILQSLGNKKAIERELLDARLQARALQDKDLEKQVGEKLRKKYPKGEIVALDLLDQLEKTKVMAEQEAILKKIWQQAPLGNAAKSKIDNQAMNKALHFSREKDWEKVRYYLDRIVSSEARAMACNEIAWSLSGESLDSPAIDLVLAGELSLQSLAIMEKEKTEMKDRPAFVSPRNYKSNVSFSIPSYSDTYALICYKAGDKEKALAYQQIACEGFMFRNPEMNERYAFYLEAVKGPEAAEAKLLELIEEGTATTAMNLQYRRLFLANNSLEEALDKNLALLDKMAIQKAREELKESMLDRPAPAFNLKNMQGEMVSLESLKGKVVIADFWATWCGPCVASFPAMQKAVNEFKDREDVEFLFIDTWEGTGDREKKVADFIQSKGYNFNVLFDMEDNVSPAFGVRGIPTKYVIDKNGVIRFESVGFNGMEEDLLREMRLMIELAANSGEKASARP